MAIFKCKMCGGTIEFNKGDTVGVCDSCGTKQTLPNTNDDVIANLYNRANNLRLKSEFDRASKVYEDIVNKDDSQAEAHWGIVLCKYGIEYVEDPETHKRIPTCHRASYEAIRADADYQAAIDYADGGQQAIYEAEAREIDKIQKGILEIAKEEKPFDVFICYKETDENGKRTIDSTIANDIYYQLSQEGFKVFYAAITLEDKLGQEYEPYIFAALNSAKVMLVIGTKPEYFNAVWVKNEWSRYLKLIKNDRSRLLIPCYRDMDAYDLPEEFAHLQAQDMSKIGFINDVTRGIRKVLTDSKESQQINITNNSGNAEIEPLLKRAFIFLEDEEWDRADEFAEQVLNRDPENARAYLVKLMVNLQVKHKKQLSSHEPFFETNKYYSKIKRYADDSLLSELEELSEKFKQQQYQVYKTQFDKCKSVYDYECVIHKLRKLGDKKDAVSLIEECNRIIRDIKHQQEIIEANYYSATKEFKTATKYEDFVELKSVFESCGAYKDSLEYVNLCEDKIDLLKNCARVNIIINFNFDAWFFVRVDGKANVLKSIKAFSDNIIFLSVGRHRISPSSQSKEFYFDIEKGTDITIKINKKSFNRYEYELNQGI